MIRPERFDSFNVKTDDIPPHKAWITTVYFSTSTYEPFMSAALIGETGIHIAGYHGCSAITMDGRAYINASELLRDWDEMPEDLRKAINGAIALCRKYREADISGVRKAQ